MSVAVELEALLARIAEYPGAPYAITCGDDAMPHVVSVRASADGGAIAIDAGRTTRRNATARPAVTLLWPAPEGRDYSLIVDGTAAVDDEAERVTITPTTAVLHRVAGASADLASCVRIIG
ncbi:MAG TPA: pyridoxamine 5'-phosphate oxidase family protein [Acidimicrobiales bacterium]|jgi:hypothetical protein|nr:pyridoxamine 5'-phosphate oxidase family protein [Acidimicrobiales bacterium]